MLHPLQRRILAVIYEFRQQHGFAPSVREIGKATGRNSTSVVNYHLKQLMQMGLLLKAPTTSRSVSLTHRAYQLLGYPYNEQEVAPVQQQLEHLTAENQQLQQDLRMAHTQQSQHQQAHLAALHSQLRTLQAQNKRLQRDLQAAQAQLAALQAENKQLHRDLRQLRQVEEKQEQVYTQIEMMRAENKRLRQTQRVQLESQEESMALYSQLVALQLTYDQLQLDHQQDLAALARKFRLRYRRLVRLVKHKQFSSP